MKIITTYTELEHWIAQNNTKTILLVSSVTHYLQFFIHVEKFIKNRIKIILFNDYQPNPLYESVVKGVKIFHKEKCNAIIAVGGGSAIDVAKCIKLFNNMNEDGTNGGYLKQKIIPNDVPFLAMPTTAGSGSEATRYAVIYYKGQKQSIMSESCIPSTVFFKPEVLKTLSLYQKKATMMDAFCHALESFWSVNSTNESKAYSKEAIKEILSNMNGYLANTEEGNAGMLMAAHIAGKAINITQTTAGHAMCYKITSLFGIAHGHAAILCNRILFSWMIKNTDKCIDCRGEEYLNSIFREISETMGCKTVKEAAEKLNGLCDSLELEIPTATKAQYKELKMSVNPVRLKNHPIKLTITSIDNLYHNILNEEIG